MGSSTQTSSQTQHQVSQPWAPAVPGLQQVLGDATSLYSQGVGSGVYAGPRVAQFGDDTLTGMQSIRDQAGSDNAGAAGLSYLQGVVGSGGGVSYNGPSLDGNGLSSGTVGAMSNLSNVKGVDLSRLTALGDSLADPNSAVNKTAASFMSGSRDLDTISQLQDLYRRSQAPSSAETNLSGVAAGRFLDGSGDPYLNRQIALSTGDANRAVAERFAASGRSFSGNYAGAVARATDQVGTNLRAQEYDQERARQASAASQIDTARQAGTQLGAGITGQIGNVESTNNAQRLQGAGIAQNQTAQRAGVEGQILGGNEFNSNLDLSKATQALAAMRQGTSDAMSNEQNRVSTALQSQSQGLQAAGMLPALDALRYAPAQALMGVGAAEQGQDQSNIDAAMQSYQQVQDAPWNEVNRYAGIAGGIGGMGGTTDGTGTRTQRTDPGALNSILGAATGIGGTAANLGRSGAFGATGWLTGEAGSLASGLTSLLGLSDERAKENIEEVGRLHDGQPVYRYNYKGDPRAQIGLLAQEVADAVPGAVGLMPGLGGLLGVDYGRATERSAQMARRSA